LLTAEGEACTRQEVTRARELLAFYEIPRPVETADEVWISKMTWLEVRDAITAGKTTVIVTVGAVDQNGPFLVMNEHEFTLGQVCGGVARRLGNILCAPHCRFWAARWDRPPSGKMEFAGVVCVRPEIFAIITTA
jgi:creatinine amidohydrolase